jgi:hypothetical protein
VNNKQISVSPVQRVVVSFDITKVERARYRNSSSGGSKSAIEFLQLVALSRKRITHTKKGKHRRETSMARLRANKHASPTFLSSCSRQCYTSLVTDVWALTLWVSVVGLHLCTWWMMVRNTPCGLNFLRDFQLFIAKIEHQHPIDLCVLNQFMQDWP